ncbi:glutamate racemase [Streptomyces sp. NPDC004436]
MKIALIDSGIGLLAAAAAVRRLRPDADLILASDPEGMPWGPRSAHDLRRRVLDTALAAAALEPNALVIACNTATVHALDDVKAALEPVIPVTGTVPAVKTAAATGGAVAIWATPATTGSSYQNQLIGRYAAAVSVTQVACPGLADAVQQADSNAIGKAVEEAARRTPLGVTDVVLGCTHYELVASTIRSALSRPRLLTPILRGSAEAVAAQALRRVDASATERRGTASLSVLLSGREAHLPAAARHYEAGRRLLSAAAAL